MKLIKMKSNVGKYFYINIMLYFDWIIVSSGNRLSFLIRHKEVEYVYKMPLQFNKYLFILVSNKCIVRELLNNIE